eukprot:3380172-Amphidinium_carterae.3
MDNSNCSRSRSPVRLTFGTPHGPVSPCVRPPLLSSDRDGCCGVRLRLVPAPQSLSFTPLRWDAPATGAAVRASRSTALEALAQPSLRSDALDALRTVYYANSFRASVASVLATWTKLACRFLGTGQFGPLFQTYWNALPLPSRLVDTNPLQTTCLEPNRNISQRGMARLKALSRCPGSACDLVSMVLG